MVEGLVMGSDIAMWLFAGCAAGIASCWGFFWYRTADLYEKFDRQRDEEYRYRIETAKEFASVAVVNGLKADVEKRFDRIDLKLDTLTSAH
jgi:hypothetical protein